MPRTAPLQVVICDPSVALGRALQGFLERDASLRVPGVFTRPEEMLSRLEQLDPDLVVMGLGLDGMGGARAVRRIMRERPRPIVMLSPSAATSAELAEALAAGALEAIPTASLHFAAPDDVWATALRSRIRRLASLDLSVRPRGGRVGPPPRSTPGAHADSSHHVRVVGVGASTGGPNALLRVLGRLPADFGLPVLVVQHIAAGFAPGLVRWLDGQVPLPVGFARDGARARPGIWFATEGLHLRLGPTMCFALDPYPDTGPHRPSLDALLGSLATTAGESAVGVVLTGMGRDGAEGVEAIRRAGGLIIAQDEASSTVFGMPRAAIESGADRILSLDEIGPALALLRAVGAPA